MWKIKNTAVDLTGSTYLRSAKDALTRVIADPSVGFCKPEILERGLTSTLSVVKPLLSTCDQVAVLGIGGSTLGAQALMQALQAESITSSRILFFDNIDSKSFYRKLKAIKNPDRCIFLLVSKSGGTIETLSQAEFIHQYLMKNFSVPLQSRAVVITESKSNPLMDWMKTEGRQLEVPLNVGGRYSVLTPVGMGPAALMGLKSEKLLAGGQMALSDTGLACEMIAQFLRSFENGEATTYFFNYCDDLEYFGMWIEQLWAESLGKKTDNKGKVAPAASIPISLRGAADQHSVLQQIAEGVQKKFVCFLRVGESEAGGERLSSTQFKNMELMHGRSLGELMAAEASATEQSLNNLGVNSLSLYTERLTEESIGYLFMTFELVVASLGLALGINPFDQPGVEHGKVITRSILTQK
ncbi:MAG: glucose-6-phosphate isomerase [Bdellovibrionales bacterium]|nr:glucose-6-phosphate isomerase [Bdellovibrionales bacterium]